MDDRKCILIVDDDENTRRSLALVFGKKGYDVTTTGRGEEALSILKAHFHHLALIDIRLPDMLGVDLLERIGRVSPDTALIVVTGYASLETAVEALSRGASAYITKPLDLDQVLATIHAALEKQQLVPENRRLYEAVQKELEERERAEEELAQERYLLRTLLENIPDHIYFKDAESRFLRVNNALARYFDAENPSEVVGKTDFDYFADEHARASFADEQTVMKTGQPLVNIEERETWPDGRETWVSTTKMLLCDQEGRAIGTFGVSRDIGAWKQAQKELEQRAAQLALLNEIGGQIAAELEIDSILERAVKLVQESFGYHHVAIFVADSKRGDLVMRARAGSYANLYPPEHRLRLGEGMVGWVGAQGERMLSNDVRTVAQYINLFPDIVPTLSELSVPIQMGQEVVGVLDIQSPQIGAFDDNDVIAMETLADQIAVAFQNSRLYDQLRQRLNELAFLNSASQMMVSSLDLEKVMEATMRQATEVLQMEAGLVFLVDPDTGELVFGAAWGGGVGGLTGQRLPPGRGIAGWVAEHGQSAIVHDVRQDDRFYSRFDEMSSDFSTRSILCVPLSYRGQVIGVMQALNKLEGEFTTENQRLFEALASSAATAIENARLYKEVQRELEERMRAEKALRKERASLERRVAERTAELSAANAELARAARLKDEFLASMSHELRTPLNAILGLSEALQEEVYGPLDEGQSKSLRRIEESGRHLLELINDILDVAKVEAGKIELEIRPVSIDAVCRASLQFVRQQALKKRIKVSSTVDTAATIVEADERRLKQILINLLTNAVKFTPEGGEVGLEVMGDAENQLLHFSVWDTGIGIAREDVKRLFEPFVQLDSSLSREYPGTGLGLALVRRLAEMHGGSVAVDSDVGKGSWFTVSLPWREHTEEVSPSSRDPEPEAEDAVLQAPASQSLILLAEDDEVNIDMVLGYLEARGYRVIVARNGAEAFNRAKEEKPDLVLMDIQMPEVDGLEAAQRIRADADPEVATIPIVALTALAMPGDEERCLQAGANAYVSKPVSLSRLASVIQTQLDPD